MIPDLIEYLSGRMPLGIAIVPIVGVTFTFVWWVVWKGTGFWNKGRFWRILALGWALVFSIYSAVWALFKPPPIPHRIAVFASLPGGASSGAWAEALADAVRMRVRASPRELTLLDEESAPLLFKAPDASRRADAAVRVRVEGMIEVFQEPQRSGRPLITIRRYGRSGGGYAVKIETQTPDVSLSTAMIWAAEFIQKEFNLERAGAGWPGRPPALSDAKLVEHYRHRLSLGSDSAGHAAQFFEQEIKADSTWSAPCIEYARARLKDESGFYEDDIREVLLGAVRLESENTEAYVLLGRSFLEFRDWDEAESALKLAHNYAPDDPRPYYYLSRLMVHRLCDLEFKTPQSLLERSLQLAPGYESARLALIHHLRKVHNYRRANEAALQGLKIDPSSRRLNLAASAIEIELRQYDDAIGRLETILKDEPSHPEALYNLGLCRLWKKDLDGAIAAFGSSYANGGSVENLYYLGVVNQFKGDYPKAIEWFQKRFAAPLSQDDQGAFSSRERVKMLRDWMLQDSLKQAGWKSSNPFEKKPGIDPPSPANP